MTSETILILFLLLALLAVFFLPRTELTSRTFQLFRVLFPSWRFYEDTGNIPMLLVRTTNDGVNFSDWIPVFSKCAPSWRQLFLNPHGNYQLAATSLLQQLEADMGDHEPLSLEVLQKLVSFKLVSNLVEFALKGSNLTHFQFQITRDQTNESEVFLRSPILPTSGSHAVSEEALP